MRYDVKEAREVVGIRALRGESMDYFAERSGPTGRSPFLSTGTRLQASTLPRGSNPLAWQPFPFLSSCPSIPKHKVVFTGETLELNSRLRRVGINRRLPRLVRQLKPIRRNCTFGRSIKSA